MSDGHYIGTGPEQGRYADTRPLTLARDLVVQAGGSTPSVELGDRRIARLTLTVADATITSLDVDIEVSSNNIDWYTSGSFTQATDDGTEQRLFLLDRYVRASLDINGTSATVTLAGETA